MSYLSIRAKRSADFFTPNGKYWREAEAAAVRSIRMFLPQKKWDDISASLGAAIPDYASLTHEQRTPICRRIWSFMEIAPGPWTVAALVAAGLNLDHANTIYPSEASQ